MNIHAYFKSKPSKKKHAMQHYSEKCFASNLFHFFKKNFEIQNILSITQCFTPLTSCLQNEKKLIWVMFLSCSEWVQVRKPKENRGVAALTRRTLLSPWRGRQSVARGSLGEDADLGLRRILLTLRRKPSPGNVYRRQNRGCSCRGSGRSCRRLRLFVFWEIL